MKNNIIPPLLRSASPLPISSMEPGKTATVYLHCSEYAINEAESFKDEKGKVTFLVYVSLKNEQGVYELIKTIPQNPKAATYKFSSFLSEIATTLFSDADPAGYRARKAEKMREHVVLYKSQFFGVEASGWEIVPEEEI